jgi:hypothetical protein
MNGEHMTEKCTVSSKQQCLHRELRKWCDDDGFVRWLCVEPKCEFEIYEPPDETQPAVSRQQLRIALQEMVAYADDLHGPNACDCDPSVGLAECAVCLARKALLPADETTPPQQLQTERDTLCLLLGTLVRKLDAVHEDERYKAVWTSYMLHGGRYTEPTYTEELDRARAYLAYVRSPVEPAGARIAPEKPIIDGHPIGCMCHDCHYYRKHPQCKPTTVLDRNRDERFVGHELVRPLPDHLKAPVKAGDPCPTFDSAIHEDHKGKCVYCGAPMPQENGTGEL